ncbi:hypothetical protein JNK13_08845 [bacterium]|nr:hypothetical protein [bacterium]
MKKNIIFFALIFSVSFFSALLLTPPQVAIPGYKQLTLSDFAFCITAAQGVFFEGAEHIYVIGEIRNLLRLHFESTLQHAMPFAHPPTALFLFFPFALLASKISLYSAQFVWTMLSIGIFLYALSLSRLQSRSKLISLVAILTILFSKTTINTVLIGQSSLIVTGLLILLYDLAKNKQTLATTTLLIFSGICCGFKPHYALLALLIAQQRHSLSLALKILLGYLSITLFVTFFLSPNWIYEWLQSLKLFTAEPKNPLFQAVFDPKIMFTFAQVTRDLFGYLPALRISNAFSSLGLLILVTQLFRNSRTPPAWLIFLSTYWLFSPYLNYYEDLVLVIPLVMILRDQLASRRLSICLLFLLSIVLNYQIFALLIAQQGIYLAKVIYLLTCCWIFSSTTDEIEASKLAPDPSRIS